LILPQKKKKLLDTIGVMYMSRIQIKRLRNDESH